MEAGNVFSLDGRVLGRGRGSVLWLRRAGLRFLCLSTQQGKRFPSSDPHQAVRAPQARAAYPHTPKSDLTPRRERFWRKALLVLG